jgi:CHAD domain-containing protein
MSPSGKWIDGIRPDSSVCAAARAALAARLSAVSYWLSFAAHCADQDIEHVHRLRVSTRRAKAALRLYRDWLPGKTARWVRKRLKKIRRAAGEARDLDVLAERMRREGGDHDAAQRETVDAALAEVSARRAAVQPAIARVAERCRREDRFARKVRKLLDSVNRRDRQSGDEPAESFGPWARRQLADAAQAFFAANLPPNGPEDRDAGGDAAALHQFRIRAKALRYAMELLSPAFEADFRDVHYPVVEELQERLGRINDHVAGAAALRRWKAESAADSRPLPFEELAQREDARGEVALREFRDWWTVERVEVLRRGLLGESATPTSDLNQLQAEPPECDGPGETALESSQLPAHEPSVM